MTIVALLLISVGAMAIVATMELLRRYTPEAYFSFTEIIHGIHRSISWPAIAIRFAIPVLVGLVLGISITEEPVLISAAAAFTGAFLLVWPIFLRPEITDAALYARRTELFLIYLMFIAAYTMLGMGGGQLGSYLRTALTPVFEGEQIGNAWDALSSEAALLLRSLVYMATGYFLLGVWNWLRKKSQERRETNERTGR